MDGAASKALVQEWFSKGITSPPGRAMVTDDFRWIGPESMAELFGGDEAVLRGPEVWPTCPTSTKRSTAATRRTRAR